MLLEIEVESYDDDEESLIEGKPKSTRQGVEWDCGKAKEDDFLENELLGEVTESWDRQDCFCLFFGRGLVFW